MSQSSSSLPSRKPSPAGSIKHDATVTIETLISYLVAAKRSLSSIHHVHRATTLLNDARSTIESTAALVARTKYLRRSLNSQLKLLRSVQFDLEGAAHNIKQDINATFQELERADKKLQQNIELLSQTAIEEGFKVPKNDGEDIKNTLHDFVDSKPVDGLRLSAQNTRDGVQDARNAIDNSIRGLEDDLQHINEVLADRTATSSSTKSDLHPPNIPRQLKMLERNAHDVAQNLENLVQHFDSCVNAIKHTEGAGAAVARNFTTEDLPEGVDVDTFQGPAESMSEDERTEMLLVLRADAEQVDDVVADIQERAMEMDTQLGRILTWRFSVENAYKDVTVAYRLLEKVGDQLPHHLIEVNQFSAHWLGERQKIFDCIGGMEELCDTYGNFLTAYDGMIVEAARRKTVRKRMEKIVQEAQKQLDQLYQDDLADREHFRNEQGEYLPSDIWHGLDVMPAQFGFQRLNEEGLSSIPDLPKEAVAGALKRLKAAHGMQEL